MGGIISKRLNNPLLGIFYYFDNGNPTPNKQPFLPLLILPPYFCSDLSLLAFSYILLYCSYLDVVIFDDVMMFEILFWWDDYLQILVNYFLSIVFLCQTIALIILHLNFVFFNKMCYITLCFYFFHFKASFHEN